MNSLRTLVHAAIVLAASPAWAAEAFVQHLGDVTRAPVIAVASGTGYSLSADLSIAEFKILANASPTVPANNNFSGTFRPWEFTNISGVTIVIPAGTPATPLLGPLGLLAEVHADFIGAPPAGLATGGSPNTNMRVSGNMFVRVLGGAGQGDFTAIGFYQETVIYNLDGTVRQFIPDYNETEGNGTSVTMAGGSGISVNMLFSMPELVLDPDARLQIGFQLQGDASDGSTTDAYNTLSLTLPYGVTLANDVGQPLSWVTNAPVPEPTSFALLAIGLGIIAVYVRRQRKA